MPEVAVVVAAAVAAETATVMTMITLQLSQLPTSSPKLTTAVLGWSLRVSISKEEMLSAEVFLMQVVIIPNQQPSGTSGIQKTETSVATMKTTLHSVTVTTLKLQLDQHSKLFFQCPNLKPHSSKDTRQLGRWLPPTVSLA